MKWTADTEDSWHGSLKFMNLGVGIQLLGPRTSRTYEAPVHIWLRIQDDSNGELPQRLMSPENLGSGTRCPAVWLADCNCDRPYSVGTVPHLSLGSELTCWPLHREKVCWLVDIHCLVPGARFAHLLIAPVDFTD